MQYIHYGSLVFDISKFIPIQNRSVPSVKPDGGLWASPIDATYGWKDWCEDNQFALESFDTSFIFSLKPTSKVLTVKTSQYITDIFNNGYQHPLWNIYPFGHDIIALDFEKLLANGYDAIDVTINHELYWTLYGWDCDSILILNPDCILA